MPAVHIVTLSRSDYASLRPVIRACRADPAIQTTVIAGGSHLLARYGTTINQIASDGITVHHTVDFLKETDDTPADLAAAYARATTQFTALFSAEKPDAVFILGDRWEMLAVATAASMLHIPIIHHSGGDITQGSADNQTRYALSCLAHLHLTALEEHSKRLAHMGEEAWRITTTGEPALTELAQAAAAIPDSRATLSLEAGKPFVLATFHPTSFDPATPGQQVDTFLQALDAIPHTILLTAPNPDAASELFLRKLKAYAATHPNIRLHASLGTGQYYAAMRDALFMIGNSSSGLWEAPSFRLPAINIGPRQQGRHHGANVINVPLNLPDIIAAIARASTPAFRETLASQTNPYLRPDTLDLILAAIKHPHDKATLLAKRFVDPLAL